MNNNETKVLFIKLLKLVLDCGKQAAEFQASIREGRPIRAKFKSDHTPVTMVDQLVNNRMAQFAEAHNLGFIGEEGNVETDSQYQLLVDPIDGTGAFLCGMNTATIIASVLKMEDGVGTPIIAIIHEPTTQRTWYTYGDTQTHLMVGTDSPGRTLQTKSTVSPWLTYICVWPGAAKKIVKVKQLAERNKDFSSQSLNAIGIAGGLVAQSILSLAAIGPTGAGEAAAMQLIVKKAGGHCCDLNGDEICRYRLGNLRGKADFLLPEGAIFAVNRKVAEALLSLS